MIYLLGILLSLTGIWIGTWNWRNGFAFPFMMIGVVLFIIGGYFEI